MQSVLQLIKWSVMAAAVALFFSCEGKIKEVQKFTFSEFMPTGEADKVNLKYTDSGRVVAIMKAPHMFDYATVAYPFTEFDRGMNLTLIDQQQKSNYIDSDYAVTYKGTDIIDLRGNVRLRSPEGHELQTEQLYYDQRNEWFFTEKRFKFTAPGKGFTTGEGIDFSRDFRFINYQKVSGEIEQTQ